MARNDKGTRTRNDKAWAAVTTLPPFLLGGVMNFGNINRKISL